MDRTLGKPPLPAFAAPGGASLYSSLERVSQEQLRRAHEVTGGPPSLADLIAYHQHTQNPVWLWMALACTKSLAEMPTEVFTYLRSAAQELLTAVVAQVQARDVVRMHEGATLDEGVVRQPEQLPALPDITGILGFSHPGRNHIRSAVQDLRAISAAVAAEDLHGQGHQLADIYELLAKATGRVSPETGSSVGQVKQTVVRGRKLIAASRKAKKPG